MQQHQDLNLPPTPTQYTNPLQSGDMGLQSSTAGNLISGNLPSWLQSTVNPNNSQYALTAAQGVLQPQFRDTLTQINNDAAANNSLNSSTFTDALARSQSDLNSQYQSIVSNQAINDANQANQNKLSLFGTGLNTLQSGIGNEQTQANATNQFNLSNYDNQVAQAVQQNNNANRANGFSQFVGAISPVGHDYLQGQGITNVPGYGVQQIAQIAGAAAGAGGGGGSAFGGGLGSNSYTQGQGLGAGYGGGGQGYGGQFGQGSQGQYIWNPYAHN